MKTERFIMEAISPLADQRDEDDINFFFSFFFFYTHKEAVTYDVALSFLLSLLFCLILRGLYVFLKSD